MAKLLNLSTNKKIYLRQHHIVGRHEESVQTFLDDPKVSRSHALFHWSGKGWSLRDASRNGTYVNGHQIPSELSKPLRQGDKITFAGLHTDIWQLIDASPPLCMLIPVTRGLSEIALNGIHALPSEEAPEVTLYMSTEGQWLCESESGLVVLKSGDCVGTSDKIWRFLDAVVSNSDTTAALNSAPRDLSSVKYIFNVSQNEEHVGLSIGLGEAVLDLGMRQHHYLALVLARKRCEDKASGISDGEQGWIDKDEFSRMLGLKETLINIHIYRLRKEVIRSLPEDQIPPMVIERRRCEIRFGNSNVDVFGGNVLNKNQM